MKYEWWTDSSGNSMQLNTVRNDVKAILDHIDCKITLHTIFFKNPLIPKNDVNKLQINTTTRMDGATTS